MIDPIPSPKPRTVWAVATSQSVYERIRSIAIARQTSNAKVVAMAIDAFKHTEPRKEPTMIATRFIIALYPETPIYLAPPNYRTQGATTRVKTKALVFDTFESAMDVCKDLTSWGGAQRVEQIAVEVEDTRQTIATDEDLCQVRDAATAVWAKHEGLDLYVRACQVEMAMKALGLLCSTNSNSGASVTVYLADHLGNTTELPLTAAIRQIVPADAAPGSEGTFKALLGLRTEQKIVALVNALHAAGVTIHRLDEDGEPIIRAVLPNALGTCTVLNL